jgi:TP901 family phage tail tape measure protein
MAGTAKQYELLFQLSAKLGPNFSQSFKNASKVMNTLQTDLKSANQKIQDVSAYQKQQTAVAKSKDRVKELEAEHDRLTQEIQKTGQATPELTKKLEANEKAMQKAKDQTASEEQKLQELDETLKQAGIDTNNLDKETEELKNTYQKLEDTQKKVQAITEKQDANKQAISQTKTELVGLAGTVTALGVAFYKGPVTKAKDFQAEMSKVQSISGASAEQLAELSDKAKQMGATTKFTATEAGEAFEYMAMAGWKTGDMLDGIEGIMNLAAATGEDLSTTSDIVTDALTAFGLTAKDTNAFVDDLAQAARSSNTDVSTMGESFKQVATAAGALGYNTKDVAVALGAMANSGLKGEKSGTALAKMLTRMSGTNETATKAMKELGLEMFNSDGSAKDLSVVLNDLRSKFSTLTAEQKENYAYQLAGQSGMNGLLAIVNTSASDWDNLTDALANSNGTAAEMVDIMQDNLDGALTKAQSALDALQVALGEAFLPTIQSAVESVTVYISKMADFANAHPEAIRLIGKVAAGLVGLKAGGLLAKLGFLQVKGGILSIQKAFTMIKGLGITKYISGISGGFGGIATKILPLVGIIAAVGGAIYMASTHLEEVRGFIQKTFGDEGLAVFDKLWGIIQQVGGAIKEAFFSGGAGVLDTLQGILPSIINTLQTGLLPLLPMVADLVTQILPLIGELVTSLLPVIGSLISAILPILATLVAEILPVIVSLISAVLPLVMQIIQTVLPILIQLINTVVPILTQIIQAVLPVIIQLIQTLLPIVTQIVESVLPVVISLLNTLLPIFETIISAILPPLSALLQALIPVIQLVAEIFASVLGSALQSVSNIIQSVMQIFQGLIDFVTGVFTGNWSKAWEGVKSIFSGVFSGLGEIFKAPFRAIVSVINTVIGGLNKLKIPDWVPGLGGKGINIPLIPTFAKGTNSTPDTFIAGEQGPELVTGAAGRKVFTAAQTGTIFNNLSQTQDLNATASGVNANLTGAGTITLQVTNSPTVVLQGGSSGQDTTSIKEQLAQYDEEFLEKLREIIRTILKEQKEQEGRVAYA